MSDNKERVETTTTTEVMTSRLSGEVSAINAISSQTWSVLLIIVGVLMLIGKITEGNLLLGAGLAIFQKKAL